MTRNRAFFAAGVLAAAAALAAAKGRAFSAVSMAPRLEVSLPGPLPLFPATNWWNTDISAAPVDPGSDGFIAYINDGDPRPLHPDFGGTLDDGVSIYGFPYIVVDGAQPKRAVEFVQSEESDGVDHSTDTAFPFYPIPDEAVTQNHWIEGGAPGHVDQTCCQDRHMLILDRDNRHLYELYNVWWDGSQWTGYSGAFFDMNMNARRPEGWTSADAAGLAITPGLVRYDEVYGSTEGVDEIRHAFRFTVRHTRGYVYPASHQAGFQDPPAPPMGARLRLKASVDISGFDPGIQKIFRAMKTYGLILADNGSDMYVSGTWDERWDNDVLNPAFAALTASDFEVVQLGWKPPLAPELSVDERPGGTSNQNGVLEPGESVIVEPSWENPEGSAVALSGAASLFAGPAGATYTIVDAAAAYGSPASGAPASCFTATGNCYRLAVSSPAVRPAAHWDAAVTEKVNVTAARIWTLHVGNSFGDAPASHGFYAWIETLFHNGVTAGCNGSSYCPAAAVTRAQMSVFLLKAKLGRAYLPPPASGGAFADVPADAFAASWIEDLADSAISAGCGGGLFCPNDSVTRAQMAVFLLKAKHGSAYTPPPASGVFLDVPPGHPFAPWIEQLAAEGVTAGCGGGDYCPGNAVTRGQMAVFLVKTFGLRLYGR